MPVRALTSFQIPDQYLRPLAPADRGVHTVRRTSQRENLPEAEVVLSLFTTNKY
jgi:hypothetical protein